MSQHGDIASGYWDRRKPSLRHHSILQFYFFMSKHTILITVDVEDWFQVENFKSWISYSSWDSKESRVERNTHSLLDMLDSFDDASEIQATFFVLGWIAKRFPSLIREIHKRGHEVASHGYRHILCYQQSKEDLKNDLIDSKKLLEDIVGVPVQGYRAPNFSINHDILRMIEDSGYQYDSSFNSFSMNSRYGHLDLSTKDKSMIVYRVSNSFYEIPISNLKIFKNKISLPVGGGGYFRLLPFPFFKIGVEIALKKEHAYLFYLHPWEIDPGQPKVNEASFIFKFRHYLNLNSTKSRLERLIINFKSCRFMTCMGMIEELTKF